MIELRVYIQGKGKKDLFAKIHKGIDKAVELLPVSLATRDPNDYVATFKGVQGKLQNKYLVYHVARHRLQLKLKPQQVIVL